MGFGLKSEKGKSAKLEFDVAGLLQYRGSRLCLYM
jgi:hypothetical protein